MLFNENGDAPGRYEIYQYQIRNGTAEYKVIGHWTDQLHLNVRFQPLQPPSSLCSARQRIFPKAVMVLS